MTSKNNHPWMQTVVRILAGSVFAYIGGMLVPAIILVVPGFIGWIIPYMRYCRLRKRKS